MKHLIHCLVLVCIAGPADAPALEARPEPDGMSWHLDEDDIQRCIAGGGCVFATRESITEAIDQAARRFAGSCGNRT